MADRAVVRYVGLNPVIRESGDSRFEGGISKKGSGKVRWLLVQAVHSAVHTVGDEYLCWFYHRIERRKNKQKAAVATARKLLVSIYHMLDRGEVYGPPGVTAYVADYPVGGGVSHSYRQQDVFRLRKM